MLFSAIFPKRRATTTVFELGPSLVFAIEVWKALKIIDVRARSGFLVLLVKRKPPEVDVRRPFAVVVDAQDPPTFDAREPSAFDARELPLSSQERRGQRRQPSTQNCRRLPIGEKKVAGLQSKINPSSSRNNHLFPQQNS